MHCYSHVGIFGTKGACAPLVHHELLRVTLLLRAAVTMPSQRDSSAAAVTQAGSRDIGATSSYLNLDDKSVLWSRLSALQVMASASFPNVLRERLGLTGTAFQPCHGLGLRDGQIWYSARTAPTAAASWLCHDCTALFSVCFRQSKLETCLAVSSATFVNLY